VLLRSAAVRAARHERSAERERPNYTLWRYLLAALLGAMLLSWLLQTFS